MIRFHHEQKKCTPFFFKLALCFFCILIILCADIHASAEPPKRIISLAPNITELLFSLGLGDRVVAVTNFCDYPAEARGKKKIGGMSNPSLEAVVSLHPDLVILTTDGNPKAFHDKLVSLGITTYVFKAQRIADFSKNIREMGKFLDVADKAALLADQVDATLNAYAGMQTEKRSPEETPLRVLFIIWPEPLIVAGPETVMNDVMTLLGLENIASKGSSPYPKYSIEAIIHQNPDVIFIGRGHTEATSMAQRLLKKISMVSAVQNGRVFFLSDKLYRLSPGILQGVGEMAECLN